MNYTIIKNPRLSRRTTCMLSITKHNMTFTTKFRKKYQIEDYICLYVDDNGFLCFRFCKEDTPDSFKIYRQRKYYFLQLNKPLREMFPKGGYDVIERDGYFVTNCKINQV